MVLLAFLVMVSMCEFQDSVLLKVRLGSLRLFQLNVVDEIRCVDCFSLIGDSDQLALIRVDASASLLPRPVAC